MRNKKIRQKQNKQEKEQDKMLILNLIQTNQKMVKKKTARVMIQEY